MIIFAILSLTSIFFQGIVVLLSYQLFKLVKPIGVWTLAWGLFCIAMGLVALRRAWALFMFVKETDGMRGSCPIDISNHFIEMGLLIIISILWIIFVYSLKSIFSKYLGPHSGDAVLLEREGNIEHRENTALNREQVSGERESVVGKREVAVQFREDNQKYPYEDPEKILKKIISGE